MKIRTFLTSCKDIKYAVYNYLFGKHDRVIAKKLKRWTYYDRDTTLFHVMMQVIVDFVEQEKAHMKLMNKDSELVKEYYKVGWLHRYKHKKAWMRALGLSYLDWEITLKEPDFDQWGNDMSSPEQARYAEIIKEIYLWYEDVYPNRLDPFDVYTCPERSAWVDGDNQWHSTPEFSEWAKKVDELEQKYRNEDQEMLKKIIEIRLGLWT